MAEVGFCLPVLPWYWLGYGGHSLVIEYISRQSLNHGEKIYRKCTVIDDNQHFWDNLHVIVNMQYLVLMRFRRT